MNVLFMCVANSARSQIAEGLARRIFSPEWRIESAGSQPKKPHPLALAVLREQGIDASAARSKSVAELDPEFLKNLDYVITLCAEEVCPWEHVRARERLHWPFPDPASGGAEESLESFRSVRDQIEKALRHFRTEVNSVRTERASR